MKEAREDIGWQTAATAMAVFLMNILAAKTICRFRWLAIDAGITVSWIPYAASDIALWRRENWKASYAGLVVAFLATLAATIIIRMPGQWEPRLEPHAEAIGWLFGDTLTATLATFAATAAGLAVNITIQTAMRRLNKGFLAFAARAAVSTLAAQTAENLAFAALFSIPVCGWTAGQATGAALAGALAEQLVEAAALPIIYRMARR